MRVPACFVLVAATVWIVEPSQAQTYDPRYPVCMQTYGPFSGINCSYTSMASCRSWRRVAQHNVWLTLIRAKAEVLTMACEPSDLIY